MAVVAVMLLMMIEYEGGSGLGGVGGDLGLWGRGRILMALGGRS